MNRKGEENLESKIIIRNYPPDTDEKDMRIMFEKYGKIEDCKWPDGLKLEEVITVQDAVMLHTFVRAVFRGGGPVLIFFLGPTT